MAVLLDASGILFLLMFAGSIVHISPAAPSAQDSIHPISAESLSIDAYPPKPVGGILTGFLTYTRNGSASTSRVCSSPKWFDDKAATLACSAAGYKGGGQRTNGSEWLRMSRVPVVALPYFNCEQADAFSQCKSGDTITDPACEDKDVVFVKCYGTNALRLVNGGDTSGRLQVFYNSTWWNVCSDNIKNATAAQACYFATGRSGFVGVRVQASQFDRANSRYAEPSLGLPFIGCHGDESNFIQCVQEDQGGKPYNLTQCYEKQSDAALICTPKSSTSRRCQPPKVLQFLLLASLLVALLCHL